MTAWPAVAQALWTHFGSCPFTAREAMRAARHDPALDDAFLELAGFVDTESVAALLQRHVGECADDLCLRRWMTRDGTAVFVLWRAP